MRGRNFLISFSSAIVLYLSLQIIFGVYGIISYQDLHRYFTELSTYNDDLKRVQSELEETIIDLQKNDLRLLREANRAGFYSATDIVIRFLAQPNKEAYAQRNSIQIREMPIGEDRSALFRIVAIVLFLSIYLFLTIFTGRTL